MPRILIVDDEPVFLNLLTQLLAAQGYNTGSAKNGEEALQLLQTEAFDLMIADINMLPVNGMELLDHAKKSYAGMSIVMLTADETVDTALEAMRRGAFDYLTKPFQMNDLLLTVRRALEYHDARTENQTLREKLHTSAGATRLDHETAEILDHYDWPGNVSELEEAIEHALAGAQNGVITKETLPAKIVTSVNLDLRAGTLPRQGEKLKGHSLRTFLHRKEKELLQRALDRLERKTEAASHPADAPGAVRPEPNQKGKKNNNAPEENVVLVAGKEVLYFPRPSLNADGFS